MTRGAIQLIPQEVGAAHNPYRVWLMDPWCRTPWYTAELTLGLQRAGHSVRLVIPSYPLEPEYLAKLGLQHRPRVFDLASMLPSRGGALSRAARMVDYALNTVALSRELHSNPPHVIHQQQCVLLERGWQSEVGFLRSAKSRGIPIVHTVHNLLPHCRRAFHQDSFGQLYRLCDALICHDASAADALNGKFNVEPTRIHVIPHGPLFAKLPSETPQECRQKLNLPSDRRVYLALGVLAPYKGLDILLSAFQRFLNSGKSNGSSLLVIAGNGQEGEKAKLRVQAAQMLASGSVRADLHYIPAEKISIYSQAADVLVYPYRDITTSGALLTGLNYCKPILASDLPPFRPYLTHGRNATLVPPADVDALYNALLELSAPKSFEQLRRGSRDNRRLQVQWETIAARTSAVYASVVN
jgi:glycosyltransferase involved in cell wall biosynthesis